MRNMLWRKHLSRQKRLVLSNIIQQRVVVVYVMIYLSANCLMLTKLVFHCVWL